MMDGASTCGTVARLATRKSTAFLVAFAAVLIGLICVQPAFAFELNASSGAAADNKGFVWTMAGGTLSITVPTDEEYASYFVESEIDTVLTVPAVMGGQTVTQVLAGGGDANTNEVSAIKTLQYPKTVTIMEGVTSQCFPRKFSTLTDFEFVGDGDPSLTVLGRSRSSGRGPQFPSTLVRFNAGEVNGAYYDVVIPSSVTTIYLKCFDGISSSSLYIPSSVTSTIRIEQLQNLDTVTNASDIWAAFPNCPNITTLSMLGTYTSIAPSAFSGWTSLEHFEVPAGITSIGSAAFYGCTSLASFTVGGTDLISIGDGAFKGTQALKTLTLPDSVTSVGAGAFADSSIEAVILPDSVTDIGAGAFANSAITAVRIPASLFQGLNADQFTGEYIYGNVVIGRTAPLFIADFVEGSDTNNVLTSVDLLSYQQSFLPSFMFAGCTALEEIAIPKTVTTLMPGVFLNCASLKDVYYYGDPSSLSIAETKQVTHPFGYDYIAAGSFSVTSGTDPSLGQLFSTMEGLSFYGLGISENNAVKTYAEENGSTFVPFAFLGEGGSSADVQDKFGYSVPVSNTVSIADIMTGGAPTIAVGYPNEPNMGRTLVPATDEAAGDCTVTYTLGGKEVSDFYTPGVYTAVITGDNESVWGTTTTTFTVSAPGAVALPVTGDTGVTASGSLYGSAIPDDAETSLVVNAVTSGAAYDALMAAKGQGILAGMYEVALMVNGEEVHSNFGSVTLTFPVDSQYNDHWATVWHYHANGVVTSERVVVSNGKVSVTVTDLSTFAIEIGDKVATGAEGLTMPVASPASSVTALASTGDRVPFVPFSVCLGASVLVGLAIMFGRGRRSREA